MDKNKIVTVIVAIVWLLVMLLKSIGIINLGQFRIILLILAALYALFFYRGRIFGKK